MRVNRFDDYAYRRIDQFYSDMSVWINLGKRQAQDDLRQRAVALPRVTYQTSKDVTYSNPDAQKPHPTITETQLNTNGKGRIWGTDSNKPDLSAGVSLWLRFTGNAANL